MSTAASAERSAGFPARTTGLEARRWIERQLRWERTLGTLRRERSVASLREARTAA